MREVDVQLSNSNEMNDHEFVRKDLLLMHIWTLKGMKVTNSMTPLGMTVTIILKTMTQKLTLKFSNQYK